MIMDLLKYVKGSLSHRLIRSSLTIISIVLGIMAIYALISFGQGLQKYVDDVAGDFGTDKLIAQPKSAGVPGSTSSNFNQNDIDFLSRQNELKVVSEAFMTQLEVKQDKDKPGKWVWIAAMPTEKEKYDIFMFSYDIESGRQLKKSDKYKVVLGYNHEIPDKIWKKPFNLGQKIIINGFELEIVGFLESVGNPQDDSNVYMPLGVADEVLGIKDEFNMVIMQGQPGLNYSAIADRLEEKLRNEKNQKKGQEDFSITTFEEQLAVFTSTIDVLNIILVLIAGISVLVAAVNIANTMYTAVLERTKEIGIMKAIGARNNFIMSIFVIESAMLGFLGGLLGIGVGYVISTTAGQIASAAGYDFLKPYFPVWLTVGSLVFSTIIGTLSGYLPARAAAKQKPVDALRYE